MTYGTSYLKYSILRILPTNGLVLMDGIVIRRSVTRNGILYRGEGVPDKSLVKSWGFAILWWEGEVVERFNRDSKQPWVINGVESIISVTFQGDEYQTEQHDRSSTQ